MKKNTLALNIGEEALIENFGVIKCIESNKDCNSCCLYDGENGCKGVLYNNLNPIPCYSSARKNNNLDDCKEGVIFIRITAVVKLKDIEL